VVARSLVCVLLCSVCLFLQKRLFFIISAHSAELASTQPNTSHDSSHSLTPAGTERAVTPGRYPVTRSSNPQFKFVCAVLGDFGGEQIGDKL
jgi:hypothetical protein